MAGPEIVPATFTVTGIKQEVGIGDRLAPVPARDYVNYTPHAPKGAMEGRIVSIYGDAFSAGQNQIVALNRGTRDGMERGHVLALWRAGAQTLDTTDEATPAHGACPTSVTACCSSSASSTACRTR